MGPLRWPSTAKCRGKCWGSRWRAPKVTSGAEGIRTPDIRLAKTALYQLSYDPKPGSVRWAEGSIGGPGQT